MKLIKLMVRSIILHIDSFVVPQSMRLQMLFTMGLLCTSKQSTILTICRTQNEEDGHVRLVQPVAFFL